MNAYPRPVEWADTNDVLSVLKTSSTIRNLRVKTQSTEMPSVTPLE
jgi:hypothetical protein